MPRDRNGMAPWPQVESIKRQWRFKLRYKEGSHDRARFYPIRYSERKEIVQVAEIELVL